jgi:hypothetical protein
VKAVLGGADVQALTPILPRLQRCTFFFAYLGLADSSGSCSGAGRRKTSIVSAAAGL